MVIKIILYKSYDIKRSKNLEFIKTGLKILIANIDIVYFQFMISI